MEKLYFRIRAENPETTIDSYTNNSSFEVISTFNRNEIVFKITDSRFYTNPGISELTTIFNDVFYKIFSSINFYPGDTDITDILYFYSGLSEDASDLLLQQTVKIFENEKNDLIRNLGAPFWSKFIAYKSYITQKTEKKLTINNTDAKDTKGKIKLKPAFFCFIVPIIIFFFIILNFEYGILIFIAALLLGGIEIIDGINSCKSDYPSISWRFKTPRLVFGKESPESGLEELDFALETFYWPFIIRPILNCLFFCLPRITFKAVFFVSCLIYNQIFNREQIAAAREIRKQHRKKMENVTSPKSRLVTLVLSIWMGVFGLHYIYLKRSDMFTYRLFTLFIMILGAAISQNVRNYEFFGVLTRIPLYTWYTIDIILVLLGRFRDANDAVIRTWIPKKKK